MTTPKQRRPKRTLGRREVIGLGIVSLLFIVLLVMIVSGVYDFSPDRPSLSPEDIAVKAPNYEIGPVTAGKGAQVVVEEGSAITFTVNDVQHSMTVISIDEKSLRYRLDSGTETIVQENEAEQHIIDDLAIALFVSEIKVDEGEAMVLFTAR